MFLVLYATDKDAVHHEMGFSLMAKLCSLTLIFFICFLLWLWRPSAYHLAEDNKMAVLYGYGVLKPPLILHALIYVSAKRFRTLIYNGGFL